MSQPPDPPVLRNMDPVALARFKEVMRARPPSRPSSDDEGPEEEEAPVPEGRVFGAPTMARRDLRWPSTGEHVSVEKVRGAWASLEQAARVATGDAPEVPSRLEEAKKLVKAYAAKLKRGEVAEAYAKLGFIGSDLVFRVKSNKGGLWGLTGSTHTDVLIAKNIREVSAPQPPSRASSSEVRRPTYMVLTAGDLPSNLAELLDVGRGYGVTLQVTVEGAPLSEGQRVRIARIAEEIEQTLQRQVKEVVDDLGREIASHRGGMDRLLALVDETDQAVRNRLDADALDQLFQVRVEEVLEGERQDGRLRTEWKVRSTVSVISSSLSLTLGTLRLVASEGADVLAYFTVLNAARSLYSTVSDLRAREPALREGLDKALEDHAREVTGLFDELGAIYASASADDASALSSVLETATRAGGKAKDLAAGWVSGKVGFEITTVVPEEKRRRYHVDLAGFRAKIDEQLKALRKASDTFKDATLGEAVVLFRQVAALREAAEAVLRELEARVAYVEEVGQKLRALGVTVSDDTTLDRLRKAKEALAAGELREGLAQGATLGELAMTSGFLAKKVVDLTATVIKAAG